MHAFCLYHSGSSICKLDSHCDVQLEPDTLKNIFCQVEGSLDCGSVMDVCVNLHARVLSEHGLVGWEAEWGNRMVMSHGCEPDPKCFWNRVLFQAVALVKTRRARVRLFVISDRKVMSLYVTGYGKGR